jgi:hypothetical protein
MAYPVAGPHGFTGAAAPPAECECSCGFPEDVQCPRATLAYSNDNECSEVAGTDTILAGECTSFVSGQGVESVRATGEPPDDVVCTPSVEETVPPLGPMGGTSLCMPESLGEACGGPRSSCLASAELNTTYCISREGDHSCPANSAYDHRTVIYGNFDDTRTCGACECGEPDITCTGVIRPHADACTGSSFSFLLNECEPSIGQDLYNSALYTPSEASGSCAPSGGAPEGGVAPTQPTTLCCSTF